MREITATAITQAVQELCIQANRRLPQDLTACMRRCAAEERESLPAAVMGELCRNLDVAEETSLPICQDTGMAVVFVRLGQEAHVVGGLLRDAVNAGVAAGYVQGDLRCSVVADPLRRGNTGDNTPAVLHVELVEGDGCEITVAPKGFGSENMSRLYMLTPAADRQTVIDKVCEAVRLAGSNPCPPVVLGIGLGGDFEQVAFLAKKALCRSVSEAHPDPYYASLEREILAAVNSLHIGPQGFGGETTALAVMIETAPTHIAGLPLAINVGCHVTRHATAKL
ncbi:MAG: fumarate hydratase [Clostridia bacterium]|nr:fumarate hydratase [Clostridia bacterium]